MIKHAISAMPTCFRRTSKPSRLKAAFQVSIGYFTPGCAAGDHPDPQLAQRAAGRHLLGDGVLYQRRTYPGILCRLNIRLSSGLEPTRPSISSAAKVAEIGELIYNMGYFYCGRGNKKLKIDVTRSRIRIKRGWWRWDEIERRSHIAFMAVNYDLERRQPNDKENVYRNTKEIWLEQGELHYHLADMANHEEARQLVLRLQLVNEMVTT